MVDVSARSVNCCPSFKELLALRKTFSPAVMISESSLRREGDKVFVWVLDSNKIVKRGIQLGDRDTRLGAWVVKGGLTAGERVLRSASSSLKDGQQFTLRVDTSTKVGQ